MVDQEVTVTLDYDDGFREGFLHGMMAAYGQQASACDRDDCPRQDE